jgi:CHAT domain-containing protein
MQDVGDRSGEATTLSNIGLVYSDIGQPTDAIDLLEDSLDITLDMRAGLLRENRKAFIADNRGTAVALIDLLIKQNQPDRAYEWVNLASTVDLIAFSRLIDAKVKNPQAQQEIDQWNQDNQRLQYLRQQLQDEFSDSLSRQIRELEAQVNADAEAISQRYPEVAELFETQPTDIEQLRASIPQNTVVIQPIILTNVTNVPNTIALFLLTPNQLTVTQIPVTPEELETQLSQYRDSVSNRRNSKYREIGAQLYDWLIRPVEDQIQALSPSQLSIIATGKLRSIPFESLYDAQTNRYLIEKYPINYLTRLSVGTREATPLAQTRQLLALGNPVPVDPFALESAEIEARRIAEIFPGSENHLGSSATLDTFKTQAPRFPLLHLATHGCFNPEGCCLRENCDPENRTIDMKPNTILFANQESFQIAEAATLGLENTELITLSACETAVATESGNIEIAGLAYLFERAGARATIATLWNVDDEASQELMVEFYQNLGSGMSKSEALRAAKLQLIEDYGHPFFWSPFILIGY